MRYQTILKYIIRGLFTMQIGILLLQCKTESPELQEPEIKSNPYETILYSDYLGSESCLECHEKEFYEWRDSHHDESMEIAVDSTVKGDFNNVSFENQGQQSYFYKKGGKFFVNTEGPDGEYYDYEIKYTFGTEPLQQYIVEFPKGRWQCLRTAWDTEKNIWFDLYPDYKLALTEWLHWTNGGMNWNTTCSDCHSTYLEKNYVNEADSFHTAYTILNVSCEACHGPGKVHEDFINSDQYDSTDAYNGEPHMYMTRRLPSKTQIDQCARCHSRRVQFTNAYDHQGYFMDHYSPEILRDNLYFPDGQILDEDYVYSSFVQTKMYKQNVKCTDCHDAHTTKVKTLENTLCLQCHEPEKYDLYDHHFHREDSTGSSCISCHMDGRYYMVNDYRRDHSFRVPRPDLSLKYGVPNSCISCHTDKSNQWAADSIIKWYGPDRIKNYADILCLASTRDPEVVPEVVRFARDTANPGVARATAIWYLGFIVDERADRAILAALNDIEPQVRYSAIEVIRSYPQEVRAMYLPLLLNDSLRSIRATALDGLTDVPMGQMPEKVQQDYLRVLPEYKAMLDVRADFPGGQLQLATYYQRQGQMQKAEQALKKAIDFDTLFNAARINLAHVYNQTGRNKEAIDLFNTVIKMEANYGPAYYSLGLLYAEDGNLEEAVRYLTKATQLDHNNTRVYYNLAIAYQNLGKDKLAEKSYLDGLLVNPDDVDLNYAIAVYYVQKRNFVAARKYVNKLKTIAPNLQQVQELETYLNSNS
ncbi:tetratricopeptide repeat protein [Bacteroidota bacterium]